jgi:hypothetical protein
VVAAHRVTAYDIGEGAASVGGKPPTPGFSQRKTPFKPIPPSL